MKRKIRPSEIRSNKLREILNSERQEVLKGFFKTGMEKILQEALEGEVTDFLGREWYQRGDEKEEFRGYRNGYYPRGVKTAEGKLEIMMPRIKQTLEEFESKILKRIDSLEDKMKDLSREMYIRGLSTRDIEESFLDSDGKKILSRSSVSKLNEKLNEEFEEFSSRDLSTFDVVYLFVDGVYESVRKYTNNQGLLCAWGILSDGTKHMIALSPVSSESQEAWEMFFEDILQRGLRQPLLITADGGKGAKAAIARCFPKALRQRCIAHKLRNLMAKLPKDKQLEILKELKAVYYAPSYEEAKHLASLIIDHYSSIYPSMVKCFQDDLECCLTHLKFPEEHRRFIRTTNVLERAFEEEKRRTKVMPQHANEKSLTSLVFAVLWRASKKWVRIPMDEYDLALLRNIRNLICPEDLDIKYISYIVAT